MTTTGGDPDNPVSDQNANVDNAEHDSDMHRSMWWELSQWRDLHGSQETRILDKHAVTQHNGEINYIIMLEVPVVSVVVF